MEEEYEEGFEKEKRIGKQKTKKQERKIFKDVFDKRSLDALFNLSKKGFFDELEAIIKKGKESNVFLASSKQKKFAVKIYKIETSTFRSISKYISHDKRFSKIRKNKKDIIYEWTKKEFRNLKRCYERGVKVPKPFGFERNVLVMEFLGKNNTAFPMLRDVQLTKKEIKRVYEMVLREYGKMLFRAGLVHADFSEYNLLYDKAGKKIWVIDLSHALGLNYQNIKSFYERDLEKISVFFTKKGLKLEIEDIKSRLRKLENDLKK